MTTLQKLRKLDEKNKLRKLSKPQKMARNCDFLGDTKARLSKRRKPLRKSCRPETAIVEKVPQHVIDVQELTRTDLKDKYPLTYNSWKNMKSRRKKGYIVAPEFEDFGDFLSHVGPRPASDYSLDRLDNDNREYGPGLCAWRGKVDQANNRSTTIFLEKDDERLPLVEWAKRTGQKPDTMRSRRKAGWMDEEIINGERANQPFGSNPFAYLPWPGSTDEARQEWEINFKKSGWKYRFPYLIHRLDVYRQQLEAYLVENDLIYGECDDECKWYRDMYQKIDDAYCQAKRDYQDWIRAAELFELERERRSNGRSQARIWELHSHVAYSAR